MLRHSLLLALAAGSLMTAPEVLDAQVTSVNATGGPVTITVNGFDGRVTDAPPVYTPFQLFLDAVGGSPRRLLFTETGTQWQVGQPGGVGTGLFDNLSFFLYPFDLGPFASGTPLIFSMVSGGVTSSLSAYYFKTPTGYQMSYIVGTPTGDPVRPIVRFAIDGVSSLTNAGCSLGNVVRPCVDGTPVTATPEPATLGLMATGLAGLAGMVAKNKVAKKEENDA